MVLVAFFNVIEAHKNYEDLNYFTLQKYWLFLFFSCL